MIAMTQFLFYIFLGVVLGFVDGYSRKAYIVMMLSLSVLVVVVYFMLPMGEAFTSWEWYDYVITFVAVMVGDRVGTKMGKELKTLRKKP